MSALSSDFYPPSNRRRCVKGRPSYTEPSDNILLSEAVNHDYNSSDSYSQNEFSTVDAMQPEDVEEEPITIDLSAFLNENPLLAQSAFESSAENNIASTESSSQFRVTDCETKPSEVHKASGIDEACSSDVINNTVANSVTNENLEALTVKNIISPVLEPVKENCLSTEEIFAESRVNHENPTTPEKTFINSNSVPSKDITLNGRKTPIKKFTKAKPLGLSNPLKKYKNFMKSKDLNKTNEKVFGKYPVVKCEKLDIENFVKNNKIKVSNWPLYHPESPKSSKGFSRNLTNKRLSLNKVSLKPKLMSSLKPKLIRKPINFNKYISNFSKKTNNVRGMFDSLDTISKPVIIRTDSWKPEIANSSGHVPTFFKNLIKAPPVSPKPVLGDLLKFNMLNDQTVNYNAFTSPEKEIIEKIKGPIVTNVNKFCKSTKNYQRIAPKPIVLSPEATTKPVVENLTESVSNEYTVIEPYIEDPCSPQKPKPILTVPIEVISSPEKQNIMLHSSPIIKPENTEKVVKTVKSVFLNGAVKQISTPTKIKKEVSLKRIPLTKRSNTAKRKTNQKQILDQAAVEVCIKEKDELSEEETNVLQAKNAVVDAMQNALGQNIKKTKSKTVRKEPYDSKSELFMLGSSYSSILGSSSYSSILGSSSCSSILGSSSYSSILNDFIMSGFSDFEESSDFIEEESDVLNSVLTSPDACVKVREVVENSTKNSKRKSKNNSKRKKYAEDSAHTSDTLSASECEDEKDSENVQKENFSLKRRKLTSSPKDILGSVNTESAFEFSKTPRKLDTPMHISVNSSHHTNLNSENNKDFDSNTVDSSHSFSQLENTVVSVSHNDKTDTHISSDNNKLSDIPNSALSETLSHNTENSVQNKSSKENCNLLKQETCTRTLRERKCSSTEVDKHSDNSSKQTQSNRHSFEKTKSLKGSINSKLKIQKKTPPRSTAKVKIKRKSCKSEDIIREINTITGGRLNLKKRFKNCKESHLEDNTQNSDLFNINSKKDDSESNSSTTIFRWNRHSPRSFSKKKRTLKVRIKRCRKKNGASCLPLSSLPDVIENANSTSSVLENNISLHSSFREGKGEKMGTPLKEENSSENSATMSECNMEVVETDKKCTLEEHLPVYAHKDLMVNSSETSLIQDVANAVNADVNNAMCDALLDESLNDKSSLLDIALDERNHESENRNYKSDDAEKSNDISENAKDDEKYENMVIETSDAIMSENFLESSSEASKDNYDTSEEGEADEKSNSNIQPETDIVLAQSKSEDDMNLDDSSEIVKVIDSKTVLGLDDISNEDCNTLGLANENICENDPDKDEDDVVKQENEIIKDLDEMDSSGNVSQANDISLLENLNSSETVTEKDEIKMSVETCETNNEESDVEAVTENANETWNIVSDKNQNNNQEDLCTNSDDKCENAQLPYSEISDPEQNVISKSERNIPLDNEESGSSVEPKKCPKLKISFIKNSGDSTDSLKDWFVSESKQTNESTHSVSDIKVPKTSPVDSVSDIDINESVGLNTDSNSSHYLESNYDVVSPDTSVSADKPVYDTTNISFSDDKALTDYKLASVKMDIDKDESQLADTNKTLSKDMPINSPLSDHNLSHIDESLEKDITDEKISSSFFDDNPLIDLSDSSIKDLPTEKIDCSFFDNPLSDINDISDKDIPVEKVRSSFSDDNPLADIDKILSKDISSKKINTSLTEGNSLEDKMLTKDAGEGPVIDDMSSVVIKEEPIDEEEDTGGNSSPNDEIPDIKPVISQLVPQVRKRKRGRPRTVSANKISSSNVKTPDGNKESSISETRKSKGQKKKATPMLTSTPSSGRKKNYDVESVRVPFSMGWMREHVIRATGKDDKRPSDIYYFAPDGTKLRSMPDIGTYLSKHPDIKLTLKNFTFAKELIYREPFEIERDARHTVKKAVTVKKKTSLKSPGRAADTPVSVKGNSNPPVAGDSKKQDKSFSENISPPVDSKKKVVKRKSSLTRDSEFTPDQKDKSLSGTKVSRTSKQKTLDEFLNSDSDSVRKSTRSSRKIVRKVPFDNSFENKVPKKPKPTEQRNSSDKIKISFKNIEKCDSKTEEGAVDDTNTSNSLIVHFPKVINKSEHLGKQVIDSSPFTLTKSNELVLNKPIPTTSTTNSPDELFPVRTSNKSSKVQNRLKVKLAPRKYEL